MRVFGFTGETEWYDEKEDLDGSTTEFFFSVGILFWLFWSLQMPLPGHNLKRRKKTTKVTLWYHQRYWFTLSDICIYDINSKWCKLYRTLRNKIEKGRDEIIHNDAQRANPRPWSALWSAILAESGIQGSFYGRLGIDWCRTVIPVLWFLSILKSNNSAPTKQLQHGAPYDKHLL